MIENRKAYKSETNDNISMLPGNLQGLPDESFFKTLVFIDDGFLAKLSKYFLIKSVHKYRILSIEDFNKFKIIKNMK
jgi:hypothetical protein